MMEQFCSDNSSCSSETLDVQPSRPASPRSSGSMAPITPTAESTVVENPPLLFIGQMHDFDIGMLDNEIPSLEQVRIAVQRGHQGHPAIFPHDKTGRKFPCSFFHIQLNNGEKILRGWLVWSNEKQSLYCLCCRLFYKGPPQTRPALAQLHGIYDNWRKLHERIPQHEKNNAHKSSYLEWRGLEKAIAKGATIDIVLNQNIRSEVLKWKLILTRLLDVTLFLAERGLPFRGNNEKISDPHNGLFLGICELLARNDKVLELHIASVKEAQNSSRRIKVTYLSKDTQNEFIECCADSVLKRLLKEIEDSKYYAIIVDATPDTARLEQNVFVLRYIHRNTQPGGEYEVQERFLEFVEEDSKTGEALASMILNTLERQQYPLPKLPRTRL